MSSYYSLLFIVEVEVSVDPMSVDDSEIVEFSWMAYDVEQNCPTEQASYYITPEYGEIPDRKLEIMGVDPNLVKNGIRLYEAIQLFDTVIFTTCQKSRKPMSLASFDVNKFNKYLNNDAERKKITLYSHYSHCIDIAEIVTHFEPSIEREELFSIRSVCTKLGLPLVGHRDSGLDNCHMASQILTRMFQRGLKLNKNDSNFLADTKESISPNSAVANKVTHTHTHTPKPTPPRKGTAIIRLRGLPWDAHSAQLMEFVQPVCHVNADDIHIITGHDGRATGEAYIVMPTFDDRDNAIKDLHGLTIGRRWIEVFKATEEDFHRIMAHKRGPIGGQNSSEAILRLRGLPWSCNEYEIVKFFKGGGFDITVDEVVMGYGSDNRLTGEAWVTFPSSEEAEKARTNLHKKSIGRRYIEIFSSSREDLDQSLNFRGAPPPHFNMKPNFQQSNVISNAPYGFNVLRLRGLPFHSNESHIVEFFSGYHMLAVLPSTPPINGRPTGEAYVHFASPDEAWKAYHHKNGQNIERRYIELFPATLAEMEHALNGENDFQYGRHRER